MCVLRLPRNNSIIQQISKKEDMNSKILEGTSWICGFMYKWFLQRPQGRHLLGTLQRGMYYIHYILSTRPSMSIFVFEIGELAPSQGGFVNILMKRSPTPLNFSP